MSETKKMTDPQAWHREAADRWIFRSTGVHNQDREEVRLLAQIIADCEGAQVEALREALRGLMNLTAQGREGGMILSRYDRKPITNGDQDIIDRAYIAAEAALSSVPAPPHGFKAIPVVDSPDGVPIVTVEGVPAAPGSEP